MPRTEARSIFNETPTAADVDRLWKSVRKTNDCWLWTGALDTRGYGQIKVAGRLWMVHRVVYELAVVRLAGDLVVDHLCRVPTCVRPDHLEPVTNRENTLRGTNFIAENAAKTHCPQGHAYDEANTIRERSGRRRCHTCKLAVQARGRTKRKSRAKPTLGDDQ